MAMGRDGIAAARARVPERPGVGSRQAYLLGRTRKNSQAAQKGPDARRRPRAAREAYSLYVERAAEGANAADGPLSSLWLGPEVRGRQRLVGTRQLLQHV